MGQKSGPVKEPAEQLVKEIRRATRRQFSAENKIGIVLDGLRGGDSIAELCRCDRIVRSSAGSRIFLQSAPRSTETYVHNPHLENTSSLPDGISRLTHKNSSRRDISEPEFVARELSR